MKYEHERWIRIEGYENYLVSDKGRIKNVKTGKILAQSISSTGYKQVCLCNKGVRKMHSVHKLVINAFKPIISHEQLDVKHEDFNRANNNIENLKWVPRKQNIMDGISNLQLKELEFMLINAIRYTIHNWAESNDKPEIEKAVMKEEYH